jgi:hypothetical protein
VERRSPRLRFRTSSHADLSGCPMSRKDQDVELAAWLLRDAVVRGVPLDRWAVVEASGGA